jgi:hypothetical protein
MEEENTAQKPQIQRAKIALKTSPTNANGCRIGVIDDSTCAVAFQQDLYLVQFQDPNQPV